MGGSESSNSGSGDDGGRSGYDVTRTASIVTFTKVELFLVFGIMLIHGVDRHGVSMRKGAGPSHEKSDTSHEVESSFIESTTLITRHSMQLFMIILVLDFQNTRDNLTDFAWNDL
ncbi:hypothetical protein PG996_014452 [Apiospora saccharicola]|uniref:Uncharacterized protein n=1 Tax=Apiospora saccharicola TaxID=335842 RepID=A0ABR1TID0_9PEZI